MRSKTLLWNADKDRQLLEQRGVGFNDVLSAMERNGVLDDIPHPNQSKYPNQRALIVEIEGYACHVPYVEQDDMLFLKTIYPSRKAQLLFMRRRAREDES